MLGLEPTHFQQRQVVEAPRASEALTAAAVAGQTDVALALIQGGTDSVNSSDSNGLTPVMLAVLGGHLDTAVQLALAGADLTRRDAQGCTALEHAIVAPNREVIS